MALGVGVWVLRWEEQTCALGLVGITRNPALMQLFRITGPITDRTPSSGSRQNPQFLVAVRVSPRVPHVVIIWDISWLVRRCALSAGKSAGSCGCNRELSYVGVSIVTARHNLRWTIRRFVRRLPFSRVIRIKAIKCFLVLRCLFNTYGRSLGCNTLQAALFYTALTPFCLALHHTFPLSAAQSGVGYSLHNIPYNMTSPCNIIASHRVYTRCVHLPWWEELTFFIYLS